MLIHFVAITVAGGRAHNLCGKRCAVLGVGRAGSRFAAIALGMGMEVWGWDHHDDDSSMTASEMASRGIRKVS